MFNKKIAEVLRKTGSSVCLEKAETLENDVNQSDTLTLRSLNLKPSDIIAIAEIFTQEKGNHLKSISLSYNNLIGDIGATPLARSLPESISEIGLVNCGIGDSGGYEVLNCIKSLPNLKMICFEDNNFSDRLKTEFKTFELNNPEVVVVV